MVRTSRLVGALLICGSAMVPTADAGTFPWEEVLHLADGHYNNAARIAYDSDEGELRLAWKWQIGTDSNTRQIAAATYAGSTPAWSFQDLTANSSSKEFPDVAVWNGVAHVVWRESLGGGDWQIFYADDRSGTWSTSAQITFDTTVKGSPVIAVGDSSGIVHIAYVTAEPTIANNEIWYLEYDTIGDTVESLRLTNDSVNDSDATIGVTAGGTVSIAWVSGGFAGAIRCMEGTIGGFTEVPTGVTVGASQPDLELDEDGGQHIAYRETVGSNRVIRYVRRDGVGFTTPLDASPSDAFYTQPSLLVAPGGFPSVAYVTNTAGSKGLYVAQWDLDGFSLSDTIHADDTVTYNETDFEQDPARVGVPRGLMTSVIAFLAVSVGYVEADTVRADLLVFEGRVIAVGAPDIATAANGLTLTTAPNPFVNGTTVRFTLPAGSGNVRLDVHDVTGRRIARLLDAPRQAGVHDVRWSPGALPAGVYWLQLTADGGAKTTAVQRIR